MKRVGITERGDASLDTSWVEWVRNDNPAILITKHPNKLAKHLNNLEFEPNIIIHLNITGHGGSLIEPNVPLPNIAISGIPEVYKALERNLPNRDVSKTIVLRVDPIIPTEKGFLTALTQIKQVSKSYPNCFSGRIRISFLDNYKHVIERFKKAGIPTLKYQFHAPLSVRKDMLQRLEEFAKPRNLQIEVCGEPNLKCEGCISLKDLQVLNIQPIQGKSQQRTACACLGMKYELLKNRKQCGSGCLYCYWK